MKVLVTGGAGFIGSHVSDALIEAGHEVLALDNLSSGKEANLPAQVKFEKLDIVNDDLDKVFGDWKPEAVCHHAAQISVRDSVADPIADLRINIGGTVRLLETCRNSGVKYFLLASTGGALYGDQDQYPAPEDHPVYPLSPYGIGKLSGEKYLYFYRRQYGLKGVALRYSNVYGPRQDPHGEAGVVAIFCRKLLDGAVPTINGDGKQTRDFVYVGDVARANVMALEKQIEGEFNICNGIETDINELATIIAKIAGASTDFKHGPTMPGEQLRSVLDPALALKTFGWKPEIDLDDGLKRTWEYFKNEK